MVGAVPVAKPRIPSHRDSAVPSGPRRSAGPRCRRPAHPSRRQSQRDPPDHFAFGGEGSRRIAGCRRGHREAPGRAGRRIRDPSAGSRRRSSGRDRRGRSAARARRPRRVSIRRATRLRRGAATPGSCRGSAMRRPYASGRAPSRDMDTRVVCQRVLAAAHPPWKNRRYAPTGYPAATLAAAPKSRSR